ncbi:hypothetical protein LK09_14895 [Microbacterium mangrovi]|uniref:Major facilitator superfamily (MFS) profile domain-containing protein n=1 Tax=Microbacterium mangrovi TaxID=1348253 RepID=A0A0B1ZZE7_9MICO|nr:MFS transporter [Microbacterium mangrovi]KHK96610.1 hypothetical protein LK09_14895 [Microbacterium mangrovi]
MTSLTPTRERPVALLIVVLFLAVAVNQIAATMIFPALPAIGMRLHAAPSALSLSQSVAFAIAGLAAAALPLSERFGRKNVLLVVITLGILGSLLVANSGTLVLFNIGRWMQAPGVIALPLSFLILRDHTPADRYPIYLGWMSALNLGATGIDGAVGGWMTDTVGYQGIFWLGAAVGVLALIGVALVIPQGDAVRRGRIDWFGLVTMGAGVVLLSVGLGGAGNLGWTSPTTIGLLLGGVVLIAVFVLIERASSAPLVEVRHLASRKTLSVPLAILFGMAGFLAVYSLLAPFWLQLPAKAGGGGLTATTYALATVPGTLLSFVLAPVLGAVARKTGWRPVIVGGTLVSLLALVGMTLSLKSPVMTLIFLGLLSAVFAGATMTAANGLGVMLSPAESPAFLPGIVSVMFSIGASLGTAVVGSLIAVPTPGAFTIAFATAAGLMLVGFAFTLLVPRDRRKTAATAPAADQTEGQIA